MDAERHPSLLTEPLLLLLLLGCINPSVSRHWWDGADLWLPVSSALTLLETLRRSLVSEEGWGGACWLLGPRLGLVYQWRSGSSDGCPGQAAAPPPPVSGGGTQVCGDGPREGRVKRLIGRDTGCVGAISQHFTCRVKSDANPHLKKFE